ncbi:MAG TPA: hypothetical protein VGE34_00290 [Candidatus Saccharimonadales bacterium]
MNPNNDHQTPTTSEQSTNSSTEAWFNGIESPPSTYKPPEKSASKSWKIIIIIVVSIVILGAGAFVLYQLAGKSTAMRCLNNSDYAEFTGVKTDEPISSREIFYAESVAFAPGSASLDDDSASKTHEFLEKIGAFYQKHSEEISMKITIDSDYIDLQPAQPAKDRITLLKQELVKAGVSETAIASNEPKAISIESDSPQADAPTLISITSESTCKE